MPSRSKSASPAGGQQAEEDAAANAPVGLLSAQLQSLAQSVQQSNSAAVEHQQRVDARMQLQQEQFNARLAQLAASFPPTQQQPVQQSASDGNPAAAQESATFINLAALAPPSAAAPAEAPAGVEQPPQGPQRLGGSQAPVQGFHLPPQQLTQHQQLSQQRLSQQQPGQDMGLMGSDGSSADSAAAEHRDAVLHPPDFHPTTGHPLPLLHSPDRRQPNPYRRSEEYHHLLLHGHPKLLGNAREGGLVDSLVAVAKRDSARDEACSLTALLSAQHDLLAELRNMAIGLAEEGSVWATDAADAAVQAHSIVEHAGERLAMLRRNTGGAEMDISKRIFSGLIYGKEHLATGALSSLERRVDEELDRKKSSAQISQLARLATQPQQQRTPRQRQSRQQSRPQSGQQQPQQQSSRQPRQQQRSQSQWPAQQQQQRQQQPQQPSQQPPQQRQQQPQQQQQQPQQQRQQHQQRGRSQTRDGGTRAGQGGQRGSSAGHG